MCLNPITIKNKVYKLRMDANQPLYYRVACGHCAECRKQKALEYSARSYAQYKFTKKCGGWSYFETLTYNESCCPKIHGMRCFDPSHFRNFMKRLRKNLSDKGFEVNGNIKYYFASEYGGKTHRPHYHVIFYVTIPNIDVLTFRDEVDKSWKYGFIDRRYTVAKRVINGIGACHYLSEYVNKDYEFSKVVNQFIKDCDDKGITLSEQNIKRLRCFHRQSVGFGLDLINQNKKEHLENMMCVIPDKKRTYKMIHLPMYIKRKLYMHCVPNDYKEFGFVYKRNKDNSLSLKNKCLVQKFHWEYSEYGKQVMSNYLAQKVEKIALNLETSAINFNAYEQYMTEYEREFVLHTLKEFEKVSSYHELAVYQLFKRGRLLSKDVDIYEQQLIDMQKICASFVWNNGDMFFRKFYLDTELQKECRKRSLSNLDDKGYYLVDLIGSFSDFDSLLFHSDFEYVIRALDIINKYRNKFANDTYFAQCEYRCRKKALG